MPGLEQSGFDPAKIDDPEDLYRDVMNIKNSSQKKISVEIGYTGTPFFSHPCII